MLGFVLDSEDAVGDEAASLPSCGLRSRGEKGSERMRAQCSVRRSDVKSSAAGMADLIAGRVAAEGRVGRGDR